MNRPLPKVRAQAIDHAEGSFYSTAINTTGTGQHEVIVRHAGKAESWNPDEWALVLRGISRAKAEAIVMILNAPEP